MAAGFDRLLLALVTLVGVTLVPAMATPSKLEGGAVADEARKIDQLVAAQLRKNQLPVPDLVDDATYVRRAFLVAIGRIPTVQETRAFLEIQDETKRAGLIQHLMSSPGYASHMSNWAFDLLRLSDRRMGSPASNEPYRYWVRQAMEDHLPWNQFTQELLGSAGDGWDPKTAAVGYYTRDRGMPLDNLASTMRVFLGKRMECAQCHDDPFGTTERMDFFQLAAFTHGQAPVGRGAMQPLWREIRQDRREDPERFRVAQVLWEKVYGMSLEAGGAGRVRLPDDYQYRDGEPGEWVSGRTPFGKTVRSSKQRNRRDGRAQLAEWVVKSAGEPFPSVIANRLWHRVMGRGIYEPIDDFTPAEKTVAPELMSHLIDLMQKVNYDLHAFQSILLLTHTFQFTANPKAPAIASGEDFQGRRVSRLSAEQLWDSLVTLAQGNPDNMPRRAFDDRIRLDGKVFLDGQKTMTELSREVLALKREADVRAYFEELLAEVKRTNQAGKNRRKRSARELYLPTAREWVRASELPSPAPRNHFLRLFGQSDREVVDGASREPNIGQVLALMNGPIQERLVHQPNAHLYRGIERFDRDEARIRHLSLAILSRPPEPDELAWMLDEVHARGTQGYRNLAAAMIMSSEFLYLP